MDMERERECESESISRIGGIDGVNQSCEADSISSIFPTGQCSSDIFDSIMPLLFSSTTSTFNSISSPRGPQHFRPPVASPAPALAPAPTPIPIHLVLLDPTDMSVFQGGSTQCTVGDADTDTVGRALRVRRNNTMEAARMNKAQNIDDSTECCIDKEDDQKQCDKSTLSTSISPVSITIPSLPGPEGAMSPTLPSQPIFAHFHSQGSGGYVKGISHGQWDAEVKYAQKMAFKNTELELKQEQEQEVSDKSEVADRKDKDNDKIASLGMDMGTDTVRPTPKVRISKYPRSIPSGGDAAAALMIGGGTGMRGRRCGPAVDPLFSAPSSSSSSSLTPRNLLPTSSNSNSNSNSITLLQKEKYSREDRYLSRSPPPPYPTSFVPPAPVLFNPMSNYTVITDNGTDRGPFNTLSPTPLPLPLPLPLPVTLKSIADETATHDHEQSIPSSYPSISSSPPPSTSSSQQFMSRSVLEFMRVEEKLRIDEEKE